MITPEASRAARGLLGWTLEDLSKESGVAWETLSRFENGRPMREATSAKLATAFEAHGIELTADEVRTGAMLVYDRRRSLGAADG